MHGRTCGLRTTSLMYQVQGICCTNKVYPVNCYCDSLIYKSPVANWWFSFPQKMYNMCNGMHALVLVAHPHSYNIQLIFTYSFITFSVNVTVSSYSFITFSVNVTFRSSAFPSKFHIQFWSLDYLKICIKVCGAV